MADRARQNKSTPRATCVRLPVQQIATSSLTVKTRIVSVDSKRPDEQRGSGRAAFAHLVYTPRDKVKLEYGAVTPIVIFEACGLCRLRNLQLVIIYRTLAWGNASAGEMRGAEKTIPAR